MSDLIREEIIKEFMGLTELLNVETFDLEDAENILTGNTDHT